jgi:hypothetical protein
MAQSVGEVPLPALWFFKDLFALVGLQASKTNAAGLSSDVAHPWVGA